MRGDFTLLRVMMKGRGVLVKWCVSVVFFRWCFRGDLGYAHVLDVSFSTGTPSTSDTHFVSEKEEAPAPGLLHYTRRRSHLLASPLTFPQTPVRLVIGVEVARVGIFDDFVAMRRPQVGGEFAGVDFDPL